MKKIVAISDTHGKHDHITKDLPEADIIIHAGDCTNVGQPNELLDFLNWYSNLPYKHKIFIAGNHDFCFEQLHPMFSGVGEKEYIDISKEFKDKGVIYLMDKMVEVEGLKIYGSPWQPRFYDWAFNVDRGEAIAKKWEKIPEGLDVLITHGPPYGILDYTYTSNRVGCEELYKKIMQVRPKISIFGHIHYGYGYKEYDGMSFFNAASLGENYEYENKPILIILDDENNIIDLEV
jgi:Icc-related predicted phosphoesterase